VLCYYYNFGKYHFIGIIFVSPDEELVQDILALLSYDNITKGRLASPLSLQIQKVKNFAIFAMVEIILKPIAFKRGSI
jgi:hypothetical protein